MLKVVENQQQLLGLEKTADHLLRITAGEIQAHCGGHGKRDFSAPIERSQPYEKDTIGKGGRLIINR